jgi:hypothetical protein
MSITGTPTITSMITGIRFSTEQAGTIAEPLGGPLSSRSGRRGGLADAHRRHIPGATDLRKVARLSVT